MSNKRLIYSDMFEDDTVGTLPRDVRLLWVGLIAAMADDQGRLLDNTALIKAKVFIYDSDVTNSMIEEWLQMLADAGMVYRYTAEGKSLLQIVNWWEYQKSAWANRSKYPAPDGWADRVRIRVSGNKTDIENWDDPGGFCEDIPSQINNGEPDAIDSDIGIGIGMGIGNDIPMPIHKGKVSSIQRRQVKVKDKDKVKVKDNAEEKTLHEEFARVWETETGTLVTGWTAFHKMVDEFTNAGVTPELYRVAIREQQNSKYPVTNPTSVKNWALGLVRDDGKTDGSKKPLKTRVYTYPDGSKEEVVIDG